MLGFYKIKEDKIPHRAMALFGSCGQAGKWRHPFVAAGDRLGVPVYNPDAGEGNWDYKKSPFVESWYFKNSSLVVVAVTPDNSSEISTFEPALLASNLIGKSMKAACIFIDPKVDVEKVSGVLIDKICDKIKKRLLETYPALNGSLDSVLEDVVGIVAQHISERAEALRFLATQHILSTPCNNLYYARSLDELLQVSLSTWEKLEKERHLSLYNYSRTDMMCHKTVVPPTVDTIFDLYPELQKSNPQSMTEMLNEFHVS